VSANDRVEEEVEEGGLEDRIARSTALFPSNPSSSRLQGMASNR